MGVFSQAEKKNKTLAVWTKEKVEKLPLVATLWDNFASRMENHEQIISKQVFQGEYQAIILLRRTRNVIIWTHHLECFTIYKLESS